MKKFLQNRVALAIGLCVCPFFLIGCPNSTPEPEAKKTESTETSSTPPTPADSNKKELTPTQGSEAPKANGTSSKSSETKVATSAASLPAELKHEGFEYYGLGAPTMSLELKNTTTGQTSHGTRIVKFNRIEGGKAYFTQSHTDDLKGVGDYEIMVDKEGVWVTASSTARIDKPQLEVPAKLSTGVTWQTKSDLESTEFRVVGPAKITTPVGPRDTILIVGKGTVKINGQDVPLESKFWCVKGVGQVKFEGKTSPKGANQAKPQTVTLEETKAK